MRTCSLSNFKRDRCGSSCCNKCDALPGGSCFNATTATRVCPLKAACKLVQLLLLIHGDYRYLKASGGHSHAARDDVSPSGPSTCLSRTVEVAHWPVTTEEHSLGTRILNNMFDLRLNVLNNHLDRFEARWHFGEGTGWFHICLGEGAELADTLLPSSEYLTAGLKIWLAHMIHDEDHFLLIANIRIGTLHRLCDKL